MNQTTELSKIRDPHNQHLIQQFIRESVCFAEFSELMGDDVPHWFDLAKCWQEETGAGIAEGVN
ncbi:MAG: hypothetical protein R3F02_02220 [Thiolinea sp.]